MGKRIDGGDGWENEFKDGRKVGREVRCGVVGGGCMGGGWEGR